MRTLLLLLVSATLLLGGCGDDESPRASDPASDAGTETTTASPSASPSPSKDPTADWPVCREVWRDGAVLPGTYRGCRTGDRAVKADAVRCEFGKRMVTFGDHFFAVPDFRRGARLFIHRTQGPVKRDPGYRDSFASCTA